MAEPKHVKPGEKDIDGVRHSLAHLLAATIIELYPGAQNAIGPATEDGFYQDFAMPRPISEEDFPKIEKKMREKLKTWGVFDRREVSVAEAKKEFSWNPYKLELIDEFAQDGKRLTFYKSGSFIDLCKGGHIDDARKINPAAFKLTKVSGVYWRADQNRQQLQRIYGLAFATEAELKQHLAMLEEAKKRDHRKLGQELDLFVVSSLVGAGLPLFTPKGAVLRDELNRYSQSIRAREGWQNVWTPNIAKQELYEVSGHWEKFGDEWLKVQSQETSDQLVMKPMNCPHHQQIYSSKQRSYRDLPLKYMETTTVYRDEKTGELSGLSRVRSITQDDGHAFCRPDQIHEILGSLVEIVQEFYAVLGLPLRARLSFRDDSDSYLGDKKLWDRAQGALREIVEAAGLDYFVGEGEAAFYGPKIDFMATDALGRELQLATAQLDFVQPERFGLKYTDEDGKEKTPVMIHSALMGSIERFLAAYIEHTVGKFPVWLAPEQIRLATVNQEDKTVGFAEKVVERSKELGLRLTVDNANESVGKKIRNAELMKIPYVVVIGEKEIETGELLPRVRKDLEVNEHHEPHTIEEFLKTIANDTKSRVSKTSL